jgi:hypothetical protein
MVEGASMKIVGRALIVTERRISEKVTKNTKRTRVERHEEAALLLECGHAVPLGWFGAAIPKHNTTCGICERPEYAPQRDERIEKLPAMRKEAAEKFEADGSKESFNSLAWIDWQLSEKVIPL